MQAYYYNATKNKPASLIISNGFKFLPLIELPVTGKREARKLAGYYNAKPWNF